jgi:polyribonucleotide nucleotidyltransferase
MATVCGASLSLMDAGVPIKKAVAGISIGLVADEEKKRYEFLTDIQGIEDYAGDMDFKVAGTRDGVTAIQLDMKVRGLPPEVIKTGLEKARRARLAILDEMDKVLAAPRPDLSPYAPRIYIMFIDVEKIGTVIGPGGKMIRRIIADTGVEIDIEDDGKVTIASPDEPSARKAQDMIKAMVTEPAVGSVFTGKVTRLMKFGAFVELVPGVEGMVHISQWDVKRTERIEDVAKVGDVATVKVVEIDDMGRINLSRRVLLPGGENLPDKAERPPRRPGGGGGGRGRDDRGRDERRRSPKDRG